MIKYLENNFDLEVKGKKVLVDFYANWCGPCKMIGEVLEKVSKEIDIDILKVDVDLFPELAARFNIFSIPAIYLIEDGSVVKSHVGYLNKNELLNFINEK